MKQNYTSPANAADTSASTSVVGSAAPATVTSTTPAVVAKTADDLSDEGLLMLGECAKEMAKTDDTSGFTVKQFVDQFMASRNADLKSRHLTTSLFTRRYFKP